MTVTVSIPESVLNRLGRREDMISAYLELWRCFGQGVEFRTEPELAVAFAKHGFRFRMSRSL